MNTAIELSTPQLHLVIAPRAALATLINQLVTRLALRGEVLILDGGNSFDAYQVARLVHQQEISLAALQRIQIARGFTCYQMERLIATQIAAAKNTATPVPRVIMNLLETFFDESVNISERQRLLRSCLIQLQRLSQTAAIIMSERLRPSKPASEFLKLLEETADQVWRFEEPPDQSAQMPLL